MHCIDLLDGKGEREKYKGCCGTLWRQASSIQRRKRKVGKLCLSNVATPPNPFQQRPEKGNITDIAALAAWETVKIRLTRDVLT